jgi:hypothetical protein
VTPAPAAPVAPVAPAAVPAPAAPAPAETPTPPPLHDGVELTAIAPAGLVQASLDVNPFKAEARLVFQVPGSPAAVHLAVKVHPTVEAAQAFVLAAQKSVTGKLVPASGLGLVADAGLAGADGAGIVSYAALAESNVSCVVRFVPGGADSPTDDGALRAVVASWLAAVGASPAGPPAPPRILSVVPAQQAVVGSGFALTVDRDATGPNAAYVSYEATGGASIVPSKLGPILYAGKPGTVTVRVAAATSRLSSATTEWQIVVNGPG